MIAAPRLNYKPHEQWSASGLALDAACRRSYGLRYLEGRKEVELTWPDAEKLPEPPKATRGASALEKKRAKAARKAWNKVRRPALGKAGHAVIEGYFAQQVPGYWHAPMPWIDLGEAFASRPGQVVLPGLVHLPHPSECLAVRIEEALDLDFGFLDPATAALLAGDPLRFSGFKDLVTETPCAGQWPESVVGIHVHLYDHKTTYDFAWVKTAAELADDPQANLYALNVCQLYGLDAVDCTWVYYRTEGSPAAHPVHFTITRAAAEAFVARLVVQALELRAVMRACPAAPEARHLYVMQLPANTDSCDDFGGRDCHASRGGPCDAKASYASLVRKQTTRRETLAARKEERSIIMLTPEQAARKAELLAKADKNFKDKRELADLEKLDAAGGDAPAATDAPPANDAAPAAEPTPAADVAPVQTTVAPAGAGKPKATAPFAASAGAVGVTFDGVTVELPKTSPLYKAVVKVCNARKAFDAALAGES